MRLLVGSLGMLLVSGFLACACGGKSDSQVTFGANGNTGNGTAGNDIVLNPGAGNGNSGSGTSGVGGSGGSGGSSPGTVIPPDAACATGTAQASLSAVNMFVMFDRSTSMRDAVEGTGKNRWELTSAALSAFFKSPNAAGLALALRFFPHDLPAKGCAKDTCSVDACSQPLVNLGALTAEAAPTDAQEKALIDATLASPPGMRGAGMMSGGTPISAALAGALKWAGAQHQKTPNEKSVVVLVTDGQANGCTEDVTLISQLSADALAADGTLTYAIGLTGAQEADMNQIAAAGGTTKGIFVADGADTQQQLLDALGAIRGAILDCDFPLPPPKTGTAVNPAEVNVNWTPASGMKSTLGQVPSEAGCTGADGWYYDNPTNPSRIVLCKASCDAVTSDSKSKLEILLGCAAVVRPPR